MTQAIFTKYLGPSGALGSRFVARTTTYDGKGAMVRVPYNAALSSAENHAVAARALAEKLQWFGVWIRGNLDGERHVFVCLTRSESAYADEKQVRQLDGTFYARRQL